MYKFNLHLIKGAGTGALGIAAAAFGAHVMLTDIKDQIELMRINVKENEEMIKTKNGSVCINEWNWGNFSNEQTDLFDWKLNTIDYILVCDCIYYEEVCFKFSLFCISN